LKEAMKWPRIIAYGLMVPGCLIIGYAASEVAFSNETQLLKTIIGIWAAAPLIFILSRAVSEK